ncbi:antibiotic biosynthesis monooxygenase [Leifsonia sp. Root227]|jgi:antibiotic biosynthesis monooxygenase (ABM) superfamily enzyme|uniref:antibiotic biosynthesis monooxygenase n=1 Tax=unclassified Leifsonia TaxID=2663824 RepID=UPI0006F36B77|nr:antibiotic biosynthesis monooxygenase [Leifsonia sp. Root227]KRC47245.1 antibiotic biosynthesis monooxygenase [Leifsonia sp. Root227]
MPPQESLLDAPQARRLPVTVSITRRVDSTRLPDVTRWVQSGVNIANTYEGFLGSGWVRAGHDSDEWHMLYRFADAAALDVWEGSEDRAAWLFDGRELVELARVERRTGIEGWFDQPQDAVAGEPDPLDVGARPIPVAPPRWKQAVTIWLGFFPLSLLFTFLVTTFIPFWHQLWIPATVLITTLCLTPTMTYLLLPFVTRLLHPWLQRPRRR